MNKIKNGKYRKIRKKSIRYVLNKLQNKKIKKIKLIKRFSPKIICLWIKPKLTNGSFWKK